MGEKPNHGASEEFCRRIGEVVLVRDLSDAADFARKTGGVLENKGDTPWMIRYANGNLLWAGYPAKQPDVYEATPYLNSRVSKNMFNGSIRVDAAIVRDDAITLISPGFMKDSIILGCVFSNGEIREYEIAVAQATSQEKAARDMARQESIRFSSGRGMDAVRIEQS